MEKEIYDTIIIGSGPAGLTAAIYNVRAALKTIVIAGSQPGGQLTLTTEVDNFPGFPNGVGGVKLMMDTQQQVRNLGVTIQNGSVKSIKERGGAFEVFLNNGQVLISKAVIVATGARAKWLGIPLEKELIGKGVSGCATCDGMFFRNKTVAVVGGGETAVEDAEFLARMAKKVYLIHRRDELRASASAQKRVFANPKIEMVWNTEVVEINPSMSNPSKSPFNPSVAGHGKGDLNAEKLENIKIKNNKTGEEKVMEIEGLFVAIGRQPETEFVKDLAELRDEGYIVTGKNQDYPTMTTTEGVFAAGDCMDSTYRQAIVAAGAGAKAALDAERWLKTRG